VRPGVAVQVTDGDRIIASAGAICIWCLPNQNEQHTGESEGKLNVFPLLDSGGTFSWNLYDEGSAVAVEWRTTTETNGCATPEQMNREAS
jgi:hypothetical protein